MVGAGCAGLVTAKELLQEGHEAICFERTGGLGGVFNFRSDPDAVGVWETCRLTSSVLVTSFSDYFPDTDSPEPFQHRQLRHNEYLDYLTRYAEHFGVLPRIRFGCEVIDVSPDGDGDATGWRVTVRDLAEAGTQVHYVDAVAVSRGRCCTPRITRARQACEGGPRSSSVRARAVATSSRKRPGRSTGATSACAAVCS